MTTMNVKGKCVPLCYPDNYKWDKSKGKLIRTENTRGKLVVCEDALEIIRSIDGFICHIAVTGPARSGKSYIASKLIEPKPKDCVFKTSNKHIPETVGIWMSTDTFKRKVSFGTEVTVIIMDTEGLDAHNADKEDGMLMFALVALISSVLVYNSMHSISAEDLKKLSWVNRLVEVFKWSGCSSKKTTLLENKFMKFFPNFFWLLRDVTMSFKISKDGEDVEVDFKYYLLEEVLKLQKEDDMTTAKVKELNSTRRAILKSFAVFDAMTLPTPSTEASVLEELGKGKNSRRLHQAFLQSIDIFISRCRTLMKPKKAWPYDGNINGNQFAKMLQQYVSRFSETKIINVDDVVQSVIEAQLQQVVDLVFTDYRDDMDEYANAAIPCQNYEITKKHNDCMHQAMRKFKENAKCINDAKSLNKYRDVLKEKLVQYSDGDVVGGYLHKILDQNEKKSDKFCRQLVNELLHEVSEPGKIYSLNEQYKERARGPQMWHVYKTVLAAKIEDISPTGMKECTSSDDNVNPVMSVSARAAEIEKMEKEKTKEQIVAMKKEEDKTIQDMMVEDIDDQQKQLETDFEERSAAIQAQIETLRRTHQALVDELQHGLDNMRVEKKVKQEELTRKQDELMRQSYMP